MTQLVALSQDDADAMATVHAAAFPGGEVWTASEMIGLLDQPANLARGLRDGPNLAAFILVQYVRDEAEILTLATAPQARRRGFARTLLQALEQELAPSGLATWQLDVRADNSGARAFYEALGFQTDGVRRNYYKRLEGGRIDAILMSKAVGGQTGQ